MTRTRRIGGADRINPQLLAKFASEIRVSTHGVEASESGRRPSAILPGDVDTTASTKLYRRGQRRRAIIAWGTLGVVAGLIVLGIAFGGGDKRSGPVPTIHLFTWEMSSTQYQQLHTGEAEPAILKQLGSTGIREDEVEEVDLLRLFPPPPQGATCNFWKLSDAPDHLVRLCFSESEGVLIQKAVRAPGEGGAETTLA
jgi:hypothetical protein